MFYRCCDCFKGFRSKAKLGKAKCPFCGSVNVVVDKIVLESATYAGGAIVDIARFLGIGSKWMPKIIETKNSVTLVYKSFWTNPILSATYDEVYIGETFIKNKRKLASVFAVYKSGDKYFRTTFIPKANEFVTRETSKEEFEKITKGGKGENN